MHEIAFEAFGARAAVSVDRQDHVDRITGLLPPGWRPCDPSLVSRKFELVSDTGGSYELRRDGLALTTGLSPDLALAVLDSQLRGFVAFFAPDTIFVHAGVVAFNGKALVVPGKSFAGKTTLVAALVRAGATYFSDEFAVLDERGAIHPYPKPLSIRPPENRWVQVNHPVDTLEGKVGNGPVPLEVVASLTYRPGAAWEPRRLSAGEGILALMAHTVVAQERPQEALRTLTLATRGAGVLQGERGDAEEVAPLLLAELGA